ncbi:MAG: hypothetical protein ABI193_12860 [Minicystis sp.]
MLLPARPGLFALPVLVGLLALSGAGLVGCSSAGSDGDEEIASLGADSITGAQGEQCDRSAYNCKVPNFESLPKGVERDTNRAFNHFDGSYYWPVDGEPALRDGANNIRGYLAGDEGHPHQVKLNFGARKTLGGVEQVYAFSGRLTSGKAVSGWIPASSIARPKTLAKMPSATPQDPGTAAYETDWVVTGGDLLADHKTLELNDRYGDLRVNPHVTDAERASDYLVRQWDTGAHQGFVNFLYNLPHSGGVTRDTLPMCMHFKRFTGVDQLESKLWFTNSSSLSKLTLHFVFGTIGGRRGWITKEMLTPASELGKLDPSHPCRTGQQASPPDPPPQGQPEPPPAGTGGQPPSVPPPVACKVLCCEGGAGVGDFSVASGGACIDQAQSFCADHGHVQSAVGDGAALFTREDSSSDLRCWAKCKARKDYHEVVGVTEDCTGQSKGYCAVGDRGGLEDAMWDRCNPN